MKNFLHIFSAIIITLAAVTPSGLVLCEKNGEVSIEFENGEVCSCDEQGIDMAEKICCEDTQCHEVEAVTEKCHEENQLKSGNCNDTKIETFEALKYFSNAVKAPVKTFKPANFFEYSNLLSKVSYGVHAPMDFGEYTASDEVPNQALTLKKTSVFII